MEYYMFFKLRSVEPQSLAHGTRGGLIGADGRANWGFSLPCPLFRVALLLSAIYIMNQATFCLENGICSEREGERQGEGEGERDLKNHSFYN